MKSVYSIAGQHMPFAYESIAVSTAVKTLTAATYFPATVAGRELGRRIVAYVTVDAQPVRWTVDGTAPVATSTGHLATPGEPSEEILLVGSEVTNFKAIREGASDGNLRVTYYR